MIPILGTIFNGIASIFKGIDSIDTSDEERLQWKAKLMELQIPLLMATVELERAFQEAQATIRKAEMKSDHFLVWSMRPVLSYLTFALWMAASFGLAPTVDQQQAFYAFGLIAGVFSGTRGIEKIARTLKAKEKI